MRPGPVAPDGLVKLAVTAHLADLAMATGSAAVVLPRLAIPPSASAVQRKGCPRRRQPTGVFDDRQDKDLSSETGIGLRAAQMDDLPNTETRDGRLPEVG
jgi:hypothetical protein